MGTDHFHALHEVAIAPQQTQRYVPGVLQFQYLPVKGRSVPFFLVTSYCCGVRLAFHWSSDFSTGLDADEPSTWSGFAGSVGDVMGGPPSAVWVAGDPAGPLQPTIANRITKARKEQNPKRKDAELRRLGRSSAASAFRLSRFRVFVVRFPALWRAKHFNFVG
jgi:hypothetical protein